MLQSVKEIIGYFLIKLVPKGKNSNILSILLHNPPEKLFIKIVEWLHKNEYKVISLKALEETLNNKNKTEKLAIITFDDGWQNNLNLLSTIQKYDLPITIFIPTEAVISGNYWFEFARQRGQEFFSGIKNIEEFKNLPDPDLKQKIETLKKKYSLKRSCMTLDELKRISEIDLITIGSHTVTHPILNQCSVGTQQLELTASKETLAKWLGKEIKYLAFPNGDYDENTVRLAKECNYKLCFTIKSGEINVEDVDRFCINRCCIDDADGFYTSIAKSLGIWQKCFPKQSQY